MVWCIGLGWSYRWLYRCTGHWRGIYWCSEYGGSCCVRLPITHFPLNQFYSNKVHDLWSKSEEIWEGTFCIIAAGVILVMSIGFLKLEQSKAKWRIKLAHAFERRSISGERGGVASRWALFLLPFITVLREGLEAVVFAAGVRFTEFPFFYYHPFENEAHVVTTFQVSLSLPAASIPLAVIVGIIAGVTICEFRIYLSLLVLHTYCAVPATPFISPYAQLW